jgi:N-acetylglutamate synthase-like GNAT family acetyltransferase
MGIVKDMRGQKAGSWFMEQLIEEARRRKDREMVLEVIEQNEPAVRLYEKQGFQKVRRLVGLSNQDAKQDARTELQEIDLREMGRLIKQYGLQDLPWQLSGETIALLDPPACAFRNGKACIAISDPSAENIAIWSLIVESSENREDAAVELLKDVMAKYPDRQWHALAIWPEEFCVIFERAGFQRKEISQWQMKLVL